MIRLAYRIGIASALVQAPRRRPMDSHPLKLFVVDDHAVIRDGVRLICDQTSDMDFAGGAGSVDEAIQAIERSQPDVVLVDLHVPPRSGIDLIRRLGERWPEIRAVVLTVERDEDLVLEAMNAGAAGYITKETSLTDIVDAVRRAAAGETVVEGLATGRILQRFVSFAKEAERSARILTELSARERQVLAALAGGKTNQQIGHKLGISSRTVASHVASIYRKLQVSNRVDAAREASRVGLVEP